MNGHHRPTVDEATWFDIQVRCLEQLRLLLEYMKPANVSDGLGLQVATQNLIQVLLQSMDHNARKP